MAQITTLKDRATKTLYPITSTKAVLDANNVDLETRLNGKVDNVHGKRLSSNDYTNTDKDKLTALPTIEQLAEQFNNKQNKLADSKDVTVNGNKLSVTEEAKFANFVKLFESWAMIFGRYDPENAPEKSKPFFLNELWFSYDEITTIYVRSVFKTLQPANLYNRVYGNHMNCRTYMPLYIPGYNIICDGMLAGNNTIETFSAISVFSLNDSIAPNSIKSCFYGCSNLKKIPELQMDYLSNPANTTDAFYGCTSLVKALIRGLKVSISFADSPLLSFGSLQYTITYSANTSAITITVHPTVYAKLTGDTTNDVYNALTEEEKGQWTSLVELAAEKNIQFATT